MEESFFQNRRRLASWEKRYQIHQLKKYDGWRYCQPIHFQKTLFGVVVFDFDKGVQIIVGFGES